MNVRKLRMQTAGVVALIVLVGWPRYRPLPDVTVWKERGPAAPSPQLVTEDSRVLAAESRVRRPQRNGPLRSDTAGDSRTTRQGTQTQGVAVSSSDTPAGQLRAMGARSNAIVGRAVTELGQRVPYARLLLRNTITGQIEARATADQNGTFTFTDVLPSGYVVEMIGPDGSVLASSELVPVQNGDLKQATVRIAANSTVRAIFGNVLTAPTAQDTVTQASATGTRNVTAPAATNSPQL